ncbi:MAG: cation:proton antiporter, partial [Vicinamibacterales bacterium]
VSMALGAFLAGMVVGRSEYSLRAASEALPMRDAFAVLFFVSVGMLLDPGALLASPGLVLGALAVVLIGKPLVAFVLVYAMRYPFKSALTVAVALAQIGEFSFILATIGRDLGVLTSEATNALVATSIASIILNPPAFRMIRPFERWLRGVPRLSFLVTGDAGVPVDMKVLRQRPSDPAHRAVVVGFGPTGRTVVRLLRDNGVAPTVIELNMDAVRTLKDEGVDAIYGDATRPDTLDAAGVAKAGILILGSAGMSHSADVIRTSRSINPRLRVLARAPYLRDVPSLKAAGADSVYSAEGEVALAFIEDILDSLGATSEQIDRERARAHDELVATVLSRKVGVVSR